MECNVQPFGGDVACRYGTAYECVMGKGTIAFVTNPEDKIKGLKILMKTQTGREFDFTEKLASVVNVLQITVSEFSAKRRPYPVQG